MTLGLLDRRAAIAEGLLAEGLPPESETALDRLMAAYSRLWTDTNTLQKVSMANVPIVSDVAGLAGDIQQYAEQPELRTGLNYALSGLGLLPFVPAAFGVVKNADGGLLSKFKTTTPGRILKQTKEGGGYSVNLPTGLLPDDGLMMGMYRNTDPRNTVVDALTKQDIEQFAKTNAEQLAKEDRFMGTWRDPETGKVYLDVSRRFPPGDARKATKFGERTGQLAGYDVGQKAPFPVGNWEDFVRSPEFQSRMAQMETEGRSYLAQHPAKEWWDIHGTNFENVYGAGNLPYVAGYTASTAPVSQLRENVQAMSEYMRRHIKGEPIVQPDWRVPDDGSAVFWQPGRAMPMEASREKNLLRTEQGLLGELQQDKVREEAAAMMGDPSAVVLDRHWARLMEDPARGIYTATQEGVIEPGKQYLTGKDVVTQGALRANRAPRDFSADVWTGIREHIKQNGELFGTKLRAPNGESKSYSDIFNDLITEKAKRLGVSASELETRLRNGDANLLSTLLAIPMVGWLYSQVTGEPSPSAVQ